MSNFANSLVGIGKFCDADCTVTFSKHSVTVNDAQDKVILTGWRKHTYPRLWRFSLQPDQ